MCLCAYYVFKKFTTVPGIIIPEKTTADDKIYVYFK